MSPSALVCFIAPPPVSNPLRNLVNYRRFLTGLGFCTLKLREKKTVCGNSFWACKRMAAGSDEHVAPAVSALEQEALIENGGVAFHQTLGGLHAVVNLLSKWIVAVTFGGLLLLRHDALALWAAMGSVINMVLSVTLKKILKQERPDSRLSSGHGMPSSHAQAIFYAVLFVIHSVFKWQGSGGVAVILSLFVVAIGSYFSWLRVLQRYHTTLQVVVGAIVGSVFAVLWFWAWEAVVHTAYDSSLLVRILVTIGAAGFSLGFISHVIQHWLKGED